MGGKPCDKGGGSGSGKQPSKHFAKSDTNPTQRKNNEPVPPEVKPVEEKKVEEEEEEEKPMRWYEMDEEDFSVNAMAELEVKMNQKVTMQAVHSIKPSPPSRGGKSKKKGGVTTRKQHQQHQHQQQQQQQHQGHDGGTPSREGWTKFFGRRWNPVPVLSKRGALSGRKGDTRAAIEYDMYDNDNRGMSFDETESDLCSLPQQPSMHSHTSAQPTAPPCKYFAQGRCRKGSSCTFLHGNSNSSQQYPGRYQNEFPDHPEPGVCTSWFYNGHCNNPSCNLNHFMRDYFEEEETAPQEDTPVCSQWLQGRCKDESRCGLRHGETTSNEPEPDTNTMFSVVSRGAGRVANAVATSIQQLRENVNNLRTTLSPHYQNILTRNLQMCLGTLTLEHRDTLLGLPQDVVGLTRFRSVLVKRTLKWAYDSNNLTAIESVALWEDKLRKWMRQPDEGSGFCKYFEQNLCNIFMETVRCLLALPTVRVRTDWVHQAVSMSTSPDPIQDIFNKWLWFSTVRPEISQEEISTGFYKAFSMNGVTWSTMQHAKWPLPFRARTKLLIHSFKKRKNKCYERILSSRVLLPQILSFLPPVCPCDVPESELEVGSHPYLDALCSTLISYNSGIATEENITIRNDLLGELVYPLVVQSLGQDSAPMITGMLLELPTSDLLLEAMNPLRFASTLQEACRALETGEGDHGDEGAYEEYEEYYEHEEWEEYPEEQKDDS